MENTARFLRRITLFRSLKPTDIQALARSAEIRDFPADTVVFKKGDRAKGMYVVLSGRVKIFSRSETKIRTTFAYAGRGDSFGEMALLSVQPRSADAEAVEDTRLLLLHKQDFTRLLRQNPEFSADLLAMMSQRLRRADEQIENILFQNILGRLSRVLCRLGKDNGRKVGTGLLIPNDYTRQEIADMVGTTREPLSRALTLLQRAHVIHLQKDGILLADSQRIAALAGIKDTGQN